MAKRAFTWLAAAALFTGWGFAGSQAQLLPHQASHKHSVEVNYCMNEDAVKIADLSQAQPGDFVVYGKYDLNQPGKKEPLEWLVLERWNDRLLLVTRYCIDSHTFHDGVADRVWANSSLRDWMNSDFIDKTFTKEECQNIMTTSVRTEKNVRQGSEGGPNCSDKLFALSMEEMYKYFDSNAERQCRCVGVACEHGVRVSSAKKTKGACCWWLRNKGYGKFNAACVEPDGYVNDFGEGVGYADVGARPAMWLRVPTNVAPKGR